MDQMRIRPVILAIATLGLLTFGIAVATEDPGAGPSVHARSSTPDRAGIPPSPHRPRLVDRTISIGRSVEGRPIRATEVGDPNSSDSVLVVGCIHGDECAGIPVANDLISDPARAGLDLWILPDLNPDGFAAGTRQNAREVDLNRNFPYRWRPLGAPGAWDYSGPRPLSEPESRAARSFILRTRPGITIWFHQDAALVDRSGGQLSIERHYARLVGLPLGRFPRYPGSGVGWENHTLQGSTAFVVELPPGELSPKDVERYADAVLQLT